MCAEQGQQFRLLGGELLLLVADGEQLLLRVEGEGAEAVDRDRLGLLTVDTAQDSLDAQGKLFHAEGLGNVVVGTQTEAFLNVFLHGLGCQEDDRDFGVEFADFLGQRETVFLRHHHVEYADVVFAFHKGPVAGFAIGTEVCLVAFRVEILPQQHAEVLVVFTK